MTSRNRDRTPRLTPALKQAKIEKNVSMHGLRHTYASMLILLKRPITEVSRYLGHADVAVESTRISYNPSNRTHVGSRKIDPEWLSGFSMAQVKTQLGQKGETYIVTS